MSPFGYSLMADSSKFGHTLPLPDSRFAPMLIVAANCLSRYEGWSWVSLDLWEVWYLPCSVA